MGFHKISNVDHETFETRSSKMNMILRLRRFRENFPPKNRELNISIVGVGNSECPPSLSGGSTRTCFTCRSPKCNDGFKPNSQFTENELTKLGQLNRWIAGNCHGNAGSAYQMSVPHQSVRAASNPIPNSMMTKTNRKSIQPRNGKSS